MQNTKRVLTSCGGGAYDHCVVISVQTQLFISLHKTATVASSGVKFFILEYGTERFPETSLITTIRCV